LAKSVGDLGAWSVAIRLVPRCPDMWLDMRLFAVSGETAGSDGPESMAVGLSNPLG
jgi:hypothetical protein